MTIEEAIQILDNETSAKALWEYDSEAQREAAAFEACQLAADELRKRQWISVKDRLPDTNSWTLDSFGEREHSNNVLATDGTDVYFGCFITDNNKKTTIFIGFDVDISDDDYNEYSVTHWQPLPEPPKEG